MNIFDEAYRLGRLAAREYRGYDVDRPPALTSAFSPTALLLHQSRPSISDQTLFRAGWERGVADEWEVSK